MAWQLLEDSGDQKVPKKKMGIFLIALPLMGSALQSYIDLYNLPRRAKNDDS